MTEKMLKVGNRCHVNHQKEWQEGTILEILKQKPGEIQTSLRVELDSGEKIIATVYYIDDSNSTQQPKQLNLFDLFGKPNGENQ